MNTLRQVLRDAVFYPCSGLDGAPVKFLAKRFQQFFYADYRIERDAFVRECEHRGFRGYRASTIQDLDVQQVFGCSWDDIGQEFRDTIARVPFDWSPRSAFVAAVHFKRLPEFSEDHGPPDFHLLFARCEAIATFRSVFSRRDIAPRCLVYIRSGIGFGGNFSEFPRELNRAVRNNRAGLPDFMLYDQMGGHPQYGDYLPLVEDYDQVERWDYQTEGYGQSHLTFARRRGGRGEQFGPANGALRRR
ncbi:MAG: hypothetical protein KBG04_08025 [Bacteroidales bacterium]|nr:hypothetical protein [Bacteroidales bacterium]